MGAGGFAAGPGRVLEGGNVAFGMGHQAEDEAGGIADTSDVVDGAVGVFAFIDEGDLIAGMEGLTDSVVLGDEFAFAVGDGEFEGFQGAGPDALGADGGEGDPLIDESMRVVMGQCAGLARKIGEIGQ